MQGRRALSREGVAARRSCIRVSIREEENVGRNERVACTTRQAGAVGPLPISLVPIFDREWDWGSIEKLGTISAWGLEKVAKCSFGKKTHRYRAVVNAGDQAWWWMAGLPFTSSHRVPSPPDPRAFLRFRFLPPASPGNSSSCQKKWRGIRRGRMRSNSMVPLPNLTILLPPLLPSYYLLSTAFLINLALHPFRALPFFVLRG